MTHRGVINLGQKITLLPSLLAVAELFTATDQIAIWASPKGESCCCPVCQQQSRNVHSHYTRRFADLPWQGRAVVIALTVRRFRRANLHCKRRIFVKDLSELMVAHSRRTGRLPQIQRHIGMALGGAAGARLAHRDFSFVCAKIAQEPQLRAI
jgi:transposase